MQTNTADKRRSASITRTTNETDISLILDLDGSGETSIDTGLPFFDHMLDAFGRHGLFNLGIKAQGDIEVDAHHTVEDVGIVLGQAFDQALGDKRGITRFGSAILPMDETLVLAAVDISGRGQLHLAADIPLGLLGSFDTSLVKEFFVAFASNAHTTLHVREITGTSPHHVIEAAFKAVSRAMRQAVSIDERILHELPSTKGVL